MTEIELIEAPIAYEWGDLCLKFADEAEATEALDMYPGSIDTIGIIYERTGGTDEEPVMAAITGWHVNTRGPVLPELEVYAIEVATPVRIWA